MLEARTEAERQGKGEDKQSERKKTGKDGILVFCLFFWLDDFFLH